MATMNAAVVTSFGEPPHYQKFEVPRPAGANEILVDVLAVGLHPRVRTGAAGAHYTSTGTLPMIPGIDGVGRRPDGRRIYFAVGDDVTGTMADKALADPRRAIDLPADADAANLRLQGVGQGAIPATAYLAELPSLIHEISAGTIAVKPNAVPLADVEAIWARPDPPGERTVLVP